MLGPWVLHIPINAAGVLTCDPSLGAPVQSFIYVAALQLLLSAPRTSIVAGLCGLVAGILYRTNFLGIAELKVR